ncbi:MAG: hypothetical protein Q9216_003749 [Gyalolechia sp. 2 TL-2023]
MAWMDITTKKIIVLTKFVLQRGLERATFVSGPVMDHSPFPQNTYNQVEEVLHPQTLTKLVFNLPEDRQLNDTTNTATVGNQQEADGGSITYPSKHKIRTPAWSGFSAILTLRFHRV